MCIKSKLTNGLIVAITGVALIIIVAIVGWITVPQIIINVNKNALVLEPGKFIWDIWTDPPFPIYTNFYVFNCTNPEQVLNDGEKPKVVELGPYSYREYRLKGAENYSDEDFVYYREHRTYYFSRENTPAELNLNDVITTINPIFVTISAFLEKLPVAQKLITRLIQNYLVSRNESVWMTVTVDELLFKGWPLKNYIDLVAKINETILNGTLQTIPNNLTLGLFSTFNDTNDGLFKVDRGKQDYRTFGNIEAWGSDEEHLSPFLPFWKNNEDGSGSYCNKIQGTDGTIFPYGFDLNSRIYIYQTDLCRAVYAVYEKDEIYDNLPARRLIIPKEVLNDYTESPENECFCMDKSDEARCPYTGALALGECYEGAPLIGSNPHFFNAVPKYIEGVEGLSPSKEKHETIIILEQRTSVLLFAAKRVQLNFDLRKSALNATHSLKDARYFVPMMWYEETVEIDEKSRKQLNIFAIIDALLWTLIAVGIVLTGVGIGLIFYYYRQKKLQKVI